MLKILKQRRISAVFYIQLMDYNVFAVVGEPSFIFALVFSFSTNTF